MEKIERRGWREARGMTRRGGIPQGLARQGSWGTGADIKGGSIEFLCRLKRDVYPDFSLRHFFEFVTEKHGVRVSYNWLRLMLQEAGVMEKEPARGKYRRQRDRRPAQPGPGGGAGRCR